jgi:hypothetical protein
MESVYFCAVAFSLVTSYPWWFIVFCLAAGVLYSWLMYRREGLLKEVPLLLGRVLIFSRFLVVSALAFLLLSPMIRKVSREVEKPILILALDQSQSIINSSDSLKRKEQIRKDIELLQNELSGICEVKALAFGDQTREGHDFLFRDKLTDFSDLYSDLDALYANRNVGAIVIASDGLYNEGASPVYGPSRLKVPVYSIGLGDTTIKRDLYISAVTHNKTAFLGNSFPLEVVVDARQASGTRTVLTIEEDSVVLMSRNIEIQGDLMHQSIPFLIQAKTKGMHRYKIRLSRIDGEVTYVNNERDVFIEVLENKQRILVLSSAPHPDLAAIRSALESSPNYEVVVSRPQDFSGRYSDFSLAILHGLPSASYAFRTEWEKLQSAAMSVWWILSSNTDLTAFSEMNSLLKVTNGNGQLNDVLAIPQSTFSLFTLSPAAIEAIPGWPPLKSPFGMYNAKQENAALAFQKIGSVVTQFPLLTFGEAQGIKSAVLCGEGIWRWRISDYNSTSSHLISNEWVGAVVQYLATREVKSPFRVSARNNFRENENLVFDARLVNASDQPVNEPEVRLVISNSEGREFPFTMTRTVNAYALNTSPFPAGNYLYRAEVKLGDQVYSYKGEFSVTALQAETAITIADHQLLRTLAVRSGGAFFLPGQADKLADAIRKNENMKSISYLNRKLEDHVASPWFFALLVFLLSLEWFIRKRSGSY